MLAVVISLLFGLAAMASILVVRASFLTGLESAHAILAELAAIERQENVRPRPVPRVPSRIRPCVAPRHRLAAA